MIQPPRVSFPLGGQMPRHNLLVVDAEVLSRLVIAEYLRECGYRVHEAASPEEATEVLGAPDVSIDLILLDVHGRSSSSDGFAFARWVREQHPAVKVVLSSGAEKSADLAGELCEAGPHLKKPYDPNHALDRIKRLLAKVERDRRPSARAAAAGTA